ncbi:hypothetical protein SAMN04488490_4345 [Marinobacter sp. LV10R510-11A]|nr:hypothetical protein SAMN04488490_4345 [Marinobacter sp. LV10R510-11A]
MAGFVRMLEFLVVTFAPTFTQPSAFSRLIMSAIFMLYSLTHRTDFSNLKNCNCSPTLDLSAGPCVSPKT